LADLVPLWRTLRDEGVTALITPALDYVGGVELELIDIRFAHEEQIASLGEALRSFIGALDDGCSLLFFYRVDANCSEEVSQYEGTCAQAQPFALKQYVAERAAWLRKRHMRRARVYLFFSLQHALDSIFARGQLGTRLLFANAARLSQEEHQRRLKQLSILRDRIGARLSQLHIGCRELSVKEFWALHYQLLNPNRSGSGFSAPLVSLRDCLWSPETIREQGHHLREYTEAEQLCFEDLEEARGYFRQGNIFRRVATLKVLPETGTDYFSAEPLLGLALPNASADPEPFPYTLAVAVNIKAQGKARWWLDKQHGLVDALSHAIPFLQGTSVAQEEADIAKQRSISALFQELNSMSSKIVSLSASVLLEANSLERLDAQTEATKAAFNAAGNSELLVEDVAQLPAFLSMLPGSGAYQLRKKACTSRNAADFLPIFAAWPGCARASSILSTPAGDCFRFDLFDKSLATAHHGLVIADTGSGKSVSLGALTLDALASGLDAILIDNGNSWKPLTELVGGIHVPVDIKTSISPFVEYGQMLDDRGQLDNDAIADVVNFIGVCIQDRNRPAFDDLEVDVISRAIRQCYESKFRDAPSARPLISDFRSAIANLPTTHPDDKRISEDVSRRLSIYCDGIYAEFLNRPPTLRFDARLLTFDLQNVSKNPKTKMVAMATIIKVISDRAAKRRRRTLVEIDEGHELLGADDAGERFLGGCWRKMRKFDFAMWMISQSFNDFLKCKAVDAIVNNSKIKIFLRHDGNHDTIIDYFKLSTRAAQAFRQLAMRPGHYSDFLLLYGQMLTTVRLALHPLAYWILTTDADDRRLIERAAEKNAWMDRLELLTQLANYYPHGAPRSSQLPKAG
jgi:hypothetical protein